MCNDWLLWETRWAIANFVPVCTFFVCVCVYVFFFLFLYYLYLFKTLCKCLCFDGLYIDFLRDLNTAHFIVAFLYLY